jgi:hypothetical protein
MILPTQQKAADGLAATCDQKVQDSRTKAYRWAYSAAAGKIAAAEKCENHYGEAQDEHHENYVVEFPCGGSKITEGLTFADAGRSGEGLTGHQRG